MALDYQSLVATVKDYEACGDVSGAMMLKLALLKSIAATIAPTMNTDFQSLVSSPNVSGYHAASNANMATLLELALLQIIANAIGSSLSTVQVIGAGGTAVNGLYTFGTDPANPQDYYSAATGYNITYNAGLGRWEIVDRRVPGPEIEYTSPNLSGPWSVGVADGPPPTTIVSGGGSSTPTSWLHGSSSPVGVIAATAGALYINDTDSTLWAVANGAWIQLV